MQECPWIVYGGLLFISYLFIYFDMRAAFGLDACCLFPKCGQAVTLLMGVFWCMACMCFQGAEGCGQGLKPVSGCGAFDSGVDPWKGPWKVTVTLRHEWVVHRAFDNGNSRECAFPGEREQEQVVLGCHTLLCNDP